MQVVLYLTKISRATRSNRLSCVGSRAILIENTGVSIENVHGLPWPGKPAGRASRVSRAVFIAFAAMALLSGSATADRRAKGAGRDKPIAPLTADGLPNVQADLAVVMDMETGAELFARRSTEAGGIASTTKVFVALVVQRRNLDLDGVTKIERVDCRYARGGARTRLEIRHSFKNIDLLRAMLIASDNRAVTALGRAVGLDPDGLVAAMNDLARELGLSGAHFTDPTGLRGNVATPRDMALAFKAALADPLLATIMSTRQVSVQSIHSRPQRFTYSNTNRALHSKRHEVLAGKTGYTEKAGYCLVIAARIARREVIMVFLGERDELTRYGDFNRVASWLVSGKVPALGSLPVITARTSKASRTTERTAKSATARDR